MEHPSADDTASTTTHTKPKKSPSLSRSQKENSRVLTQEELKAWWPFTRLDPKRFPKERSVYETAEPAPF